MSAQRKRDALTMPAHDVLPFRKNDADRRRGMVRYMTPEGIAALLDLRDRAEAHLVARGKDA